MSSRSKLDYALLLILSTLWGASYIFIRIAVASIPPITLIAARTLIAGVLLSMWIAKRRIPVPRDGAIWRRFLVQALLNSVVPFTLVAWAEQAVPAGVATILSSASPIVVFIGTGLLARQERTPWRKLLGVVLGFGGIVLIVGVEVARGVGGQLWPQLALVAATICYGGAAMYGRSFRGLPPVVPAACSLMIGFVLLLPVSLAFERPWLLHPSLRSLAALAGLALFSTAGAFAIYFRLIRTLGPVATTSQAYLRVPIGVALSVLFLGESLSPTAAAGLVCVVSGVAALAIP